MPESVFANTAPDFTIYYLSGSGFTSPTWNGYPAAAIDSLPIFEDSKLNISFLAAIPGITLTPETSTDLQTWTTQGVTLSEIGVDNRRTASVTVDAPERYLRLRVGEE